MNIALIGWLVIGGPSVFASSLVECEIAAAQLAKPSLRVSVLQALPQSKRFGVALLVELKEGPPVLVVGGGVTVGHSDLLEQAKKKYGDRIVSTRMWGELQIENKSKELAVGKISAATPTSGTWHKQYDGKPGHSNTIANLGSALAAQNKIPVDPKGLREFDKNQVHLDPMLVGRHRADGIISSATMHLERLTSNLYGDEFNEGDFKSAYAEFAPKMTELLSELSLYFDGMVNDGAMSPQKRQTIAAQMAANFGPDSKPNLESMRQFFRSFEEAVEPAAEISRDPGPFIEFIPLD